MKKIYFLLLFIIISPFLQAQYSSYDVGRWSLGLNVGGSFQQADVSNDFFGLGYGATLEYHLLRKSYSYFGVSLRGRYLNTRTYGQDYTLHSGLISNDAINGVNSPTIDYSNSPIFLNNKTLVNEFSLELMLKWNKWYQEKGVLFYLYLGGGGTEFETSTNQLDAFGNVYDYSVININTGKSNTLSQIETLNDGSYESALTNKDAKTFVFTPTVGLGLGFRVVPGFDIALEHKISVPQTDFYDGQMNAPTTSFIKDVYHYTSLGFIFTIVRNNFKENSETFTPTVIPSPTVTPTPITTTPTYTLKKPEITIVKPTISSYNYPDCSIEIVAKIEPVVSKNDIEFFQNGQKVLPQYFTYNSPEFKANVSLKEGINTFKITAKNTSASTTKEFTFTCKDENYITICHSKSNGQKEVISIKSSEWEMHQAHGDTKGKCPEEKKMITICHNVPGQSGVTQTIDIPESEWLIHKSHGDIMGKCYTVPKKQISICLNNQNLTINESQWFSYQSQGATLGACPQIKMLTICIIPPTGNVRKTITIPETEWASYQAQGAILGACPPVEPTTVICHKNANGTKVTMTIPEFRWVEHFNHGDTRGVCPKEEKKITICLNNKNLTINESQWFSYQSQGATLGVCPKEEKKITICLNNKTLTINESQWFSYQSQGATLGVCPKEEKKITICLDNKNLTINESQWLSYQSQGATLGVCPKEEKKITICHYPPGNTGNPQTIEIPVNAWSAHQAHGDVQGPCPQITTPPDTSGTGNSGNGNKKITICHYPPGNTGNPQTIEIAQSAWAAHQAHGDTLGECGSSNKNKGEIKKGILKP